MYIIHVSMYIIFSDLWQQFFFEARYSGSGLFDFPTKKPANKHLE